MNRTMELIQNLREEIDALEKDLYFDDVSVEGAKKKYQLEILESTLNSAYKQMSNFNQFSSKYVLIRGWLGGYDFRF